MTQTNYIAAISSYGTVSNPVKRYIAAISYSDKEKMLETLKGFLSAQVLLAKTSPEYRKELEEGVDSAKALSEIEEGINEFSVEYDSLLSARSLTDLDDLRLIISIPEILTDYHIEILPIGSYEISWMEEKKEIGIMAHAALEGCGAPAEFYSVCKVCDPIEEVEVIFGIKDPSPLEEWNNLVGEGSIVPLLKA